MDREDIRERLLAHAIESLKTIDTQLNILMDGYDFYVNNFDPKTAGDHLMLADVGVSVKALGELPKSVQMQVHDWKHGVEPQLSREGFEIFILNEFNLHLFAVASFLNWKKINVEPLNPKLIGQSFNVLREANRLMPRSTETS